MPGDRSFIRELCADLQRPRKLFVGHCRIAQHVFCALRNFMVEQALNIEVRVDPDIDHMQRHAMQTCKNVDSGSPRQEVEHHLVRDCARVCAYALGGDAMIRSEYIDSLVERQRKMFVPDHHQLSGEVFEPAKAAHGFGELVQTCACASSPDLVRRLNPADRFCYYRCA
jgi:hypothetical protein